MLGPIRPQGPTQRRRRRPVSQLSALPARFLMEGDRSDSGIDARRDRPAVDRIGRTSRSSSRRCLQRTIPTGQPTGLLTDNPFPLLDEPDHTGARRIGTPASSGQRSKGHSGHRRVCLLTGASGTLGSELCNSLADRYDFAAVHHRRPISSDVFAIEADLTEQGECERIVEVALSRFGRIDLVVNAAVASTWGPMLESSAVGTVLPQQLMMNVVVPLQVACATARLFWQDFVDENRAAGRNVINMSSISGQNLFPGEGQSVYAASKAALDHLTGHMALEFAADRCTGERRRAEQLSS